MRNIKFSISILLLSILASCTKDPAPNLAWKFSDKDELKYSYIQTSKAKQSIGEREKVNEFKLQGFLALMIQEDTTANLELRDVTSSMWFPGSTDTARNIAEDNIIALGLQTNGKPVNPSQKGSDIFEFLFILPDSTLAAGESITRPTKFPFNASDGVYWIRGEQKITLKEYKEINGEKVAVILTEISASEMDAPAELKKQFDCAVKGASEFEFNMKEQLFNSGTIDLNIDLTNRQFGEDGITTIKTISDVHYDLKLIEFTSK